MPVFLRYEVQREIPQFSQRKLATPIRKSTNKSEIRRKCTELFTY